MGIEAGIAMNGGEDMVMRIAIIGMGQIARTQHLPAIAASDAFELAAVVNPVAVETPSGVPLFESFARLLASGTAIDAVAICTPPRIRYGIARQALQAGLHVLSEKPPTQTVLEAIDLQGLAASARRTLFATWHSRFSRGALEARTIVASRDVQTVRIVWKEDSEKWHPHVTWFWEPAGFGVFDPGINAISILQMVMPSPIFFHEAMLEQRPGHYAPCRADVTFRMADASPQMTGHFDCVYQSGDEVWSIVWQFTDGSKLTLTNGGATLQLDEKVLVSGATGGLSPLDGEYRSLYRRFAELVSESRSDVDVAPLQMITDILAFGQRQLVP